MLIALVICFLLIAVLFCWVGIITFVMSESLRATVNKEFKRGERKDSK